MKVYLEVHGCTANYGDAEIMSSVLEQRGHQIVGEIENADILVLLTCIVIDTTEQRMLSRLREFAKTGKPVVVAGCMASARRDLALKIRPETIFIKPSDVPAAADIIEGRIPERIIPKIDIPVKYCSIHAIIQISEGCTSACAYCITKMARGKLVSHDPNKIIECAKRALDSGCKELWITAQDTADYGIDLKNIKLPDLLGMISEIPGEFKIRVGMMGVKSAIRSLDGLVEAYKSPKIYKFLHLPVQSGDDLVLRRMGRGYKAADFEEVVWRFREEFPELVLSTDIIVGFPGEGEEAFERTLDLLQRTKPDVVNIKRFSPRPGTKAYEFPERTPTQVLKERSRNAAALCGKIGMEINKRYVGRRFEILITEEGKNNSVVGRLNNYKPVVIRRKGSEDLGLGCKMWVKINSATQTYLIGEIVKI